MLLSDYAKSVLDDGNLLREKLALYLQTPDKVEIYAQACEKFFINGAKLDLKFSPTWSWWGFFCHIWFCLYRKLYLVAGVLFIGSLLGGVVPVIALIVWIADGMVAKYFVCKRFVETLEMSNQLGNDDILIANGGVNKWAVWVGVIMSILAIILIISAIMVIGSAMSQM